MLRVKKHGKWGFIDKLGKEVIPCIYDEVRDLHGDIIEVYKDLRWKKIFKIGNYFTNAYDQIGEYKDGIARALRDNKWGFINKEGKEIIPCEYDAVGEYFIDGLLEVKKGNKWGFINKAGKIVVPYIYDFNHNFRDGLAKVRKDYNWGLIDKDGREVVSCSYSEIRDFKNGYARVKSSQKYWGFINKDGKEVIPCIYTEALDFEKGFAKVRRGGNWGLIDTAGNKIVPFIYSDHANLYDTTAFKRHINNDPKDIIDKLLNLF